MTLANKNFQIYSIMITSSYLVEPSMHLVTEKDIELREKVLKLCPVSSFGMVQVLLTYDPHHSLLKTTQHTKLQYMTIHSLTYAM